MQVNNNCFINILLFADDLVLLGESEDELQLLLYKFSKMAEEYDCKISPTKTKVMAFVGEEPVRSKIVINNQVQEQVAISLI